MKRQAVNDSLVGKNPIKISIHFLYGSLANLKLIWSLCWLNSRSRWFFWQGNLEERILIMFWCKRRRLKNMLCVRSGRGKEASHFFFAFLFSFYIWRHCLGGEKWSHWLINFWVMLFEWGSLWLPMSLWLSITKLLSCLSCCGISKF